MRDYLFSTKENETIFRRLDKSLFYKLSLKKKQKMMHVILGRLFVGILGTFTLFYVAKSLALALSSSGFYSAIITFMREGLIFSNFTDAFYILYDYMPVPQTILLLAFSVFLLYTVKEIINLSKKYSRAFKELRYQL